MQILLKILHLLYVVAFVSVTLYFVFIFTLVLFSRFLFVPVSGQLSTMQLRVAQPVNTRTATPGKGLLVDIEYKYVYNEKTYTGTRVFPYGPNNMNSQQFQWLFATEQQHNPDSTIIAKVAENPFGTTSDTIIRKDITVQVVKYFPAKSCLTLEKTSVTLLVIFFVFYLAFMHFMPYMIRPDYYQILFRL